eukprot:gene4487-5082_t
MDPNSEAQNALLQNWDRMFPYAFLPFNLTGQTLKKVLKHKIKMILITPIWVTQSWYPQLLGMATQPNNPTTNRETTIEPTGNNSPTTGKQNSKTSGMADLSKRMQNSGLSKSASRLIVNSRSIGTRSNYNTAWEMFSSWCHQQQVDPFRCSINSGQHPKVKALLKGISKERPPLPKYSFVWDDRSLCPVECIDKYLDISQQWRQNLTAEQKDSFWLSFSPPRKQVSKSTITRWIMSLLGRAGIDTKTFKSHSLRSASSSKVSKAGLPATDILKRGNWKGISGAAPEEEEEEQEEEAKGGRTIKKH